MRQRLTSYSVLLLLTIGIYACGLAPAKPASFKKPAPVRLSRSEAGGQATLSLYPERNLLQFEFVPQENKPGAELSMTQRLAVCKPLLERVFRDQGAKAEYLAGCGEYPELATRIAVAAASSGRWNLKTGQPISGKANAGLKDLLMHDRLFPELERFFGSFGYQVSVHSVESVMLCRWKEIQTRRQNASPVGPWPEDSLVPCGGSILFRLTKSKE